MVWRRTKKDFSKLNHEEKAKSVNFAQLLDMVAQVDPELRIRFSTSHPKDMTDDVLYIMAKHENICNYIHLPVQSGNNRILELMNRGYTREWYINRVDAIKRIIPDCGISMDIISGFCSETEEEHKDTLSLMEYVKYDFGFMFNYSERPNTQAQRKLEDDISDEVKKRRLKEIIDLQMQHSYFRNQEHVGKVHKILVEGVSKKSDNELFGRNTQNTVVVFPRENYKAGQYVNVEVYECTSRYIERKGNWLSMIKHADIKQRFGILGNSPKLDRAIEVALQVAPTDISVLITGESGTGKEAMPKIIHHSSQRKHGNYIAVNCGAIPEGTIDSELFGHEKGAFTGANDNRKGYFEVADGGTIFLDEVGELPLSTQVRLLRVLESGEFMKVGSSESQRTDVRVVAATNVNLDKAIQKGKFREDLYYRLNTIHITIPPLRDRRGHTSAF